MQFKNTQLVKILGCSQTTEDKWIDSINKACAKFGIDTKLRLAAFIAQVGHESNRLADVEENLNYSAEGLQKTWPNRFDETNAQTYARKPMLIASKVYGGRMGNGQEVTGEGWKYRGRGLIQCTGKANYDAFSQECGVDAVNNPDSLAQPDNAALSAAWFWGSKGLNAYADRGDFLSITKRINGGTIGQEDRERLYKKALIVLGDQEPPKTDEELDKTPVPPNPYVTDPINEQKTPAAQNSSIVEPRAAFGSSGKYPWNLVYESRSGHVTEVDDTPGAERLNMTHRTGSYWEITPDGSFTQKSVLDSYRLTREDSYDYTGANHTGEVKGTLYQRIGGKATYKTGEYTIHAPRMQFNTSSLNVSGEVNARQVNAPMFSGHGGSMAFGQLLAKESIVAYYVKKGKVPMLGGSLGFKGIPGVEGNADGAMTNDLSNKAPNGTPWITNGIIPSAVSAAAATAVAAAVVTDLLKKNDADERTANAMNSVASDLDKQESLSDAAQTPVFLKHVTFDKPTLLSQSLSVNPPDPSLYVNNYHTMVDSTGKGKLFISHGDAWVPVGDAAEANQHTDAAVAGVADQFNNALLNEINNRVAALLDEVDARNAAIADEALQRQEAIESGLLSEALARGAAVTAEAEARQTEDESLSNRIVTLTAAVDGNAAAIQQETEARVTALAAEATARETLATTVDGNTASIYTESTARSTADSALSTRIDDLVASTDDSFALVTTQITALTDTDSATASQLTSIQSQIDDANAAILTESNTRATDVSAVASNVTALTATVNSNTSAIATESTTRADADGALSTRIDAVVSTANNAAAAVITESNTRASADSAISSRVDVVEANVSNNTAAILSEQSARSSADTAIVNSVNSLTAQVAVRPNLLYNGGFEMGLDGWTVSSGVGFSVNDSSWGRYASVTTTPTGVGVLTSNIAIPVYADNYYTISADLMLFATDAYAYVDLVFTNDAGTVLLDGPQQTQSASFDFRQNGSGRKLCEVHCLAPTGATKAYARFVYVINSGGTNAGVRQIKVEFGALPSTPYTNERTTVALNAAIVSEQTARASGDSANASSITTLTSRVDGHDSSIASVTTQASTNATAIGYVNALYGVRLNVNGYISGFSVNSAAIPGGSGAQSNFIIQSDKFALYSSSSGAVSSAPFSVDAITGKAIFTGSLSVQSATSGARTEIYSHVIKVFDASGVKRVQIGDLSA